MCRPRIPPTARRSSAPHRRRLIAAALVAAAVFSTPALAAGPAARCNAKLRKHDGVDVFGLSPNQVLALAKDLGDTEPLLRPGFRPLRLQLKRAAHLGRIYSRAYRADPSDNSLPQEAAFENSLLRLERLARASDLPACSVRLAAP
jgi:hypothetical protein